MSRLRIISGQAKGRRLYMVPGDTTRPISDRVKESLFNIIGEEIRGSHFLDLFAGTGSVGIEALSRGAEHVHLNDNNIHAVRTIQKNLIHTKLEANAVVTHMDAYDLVRRIDLEPFDYIYIAPPQYQGIWRATLQFVDDTPQILNPDGWVIVQIDPTEFEAIKLEHLVEFDQRKYGNTKLVFFEAPGD